jgi:hypothetical protein
MSPGTLVHLTETANLSAGIDPKLELFGMILGPVDYKSIVDARPDEYIRGTESTSCYRVLLSNSDIEIFYIEDLEEMNEEDHSC